MTKRKAKTSVYKRAREFNPTDFVLGSATPPNKKYRWCVIAPAAVQAFNYSNRKWWPSRWAAGQHASQTIKREQERNNSITLVVVNAVDLIGLDVPQPPVMIRPI